ncbi:MAG: tetratricopeptide repeat protein [Kofleriaceae bacterium]
MSDRQIQILIEQADVRRRLADWNGAIELLRRALSLDPDHAHAHAALSLVLLGAVRLDGARIEARAALALDGNDAFCHYAMAAVLCADRKLDEAWRHYLVAVEVDHTDPDVYVLGARIRELRGERGEARALLHEALELAPAHTSALTQLAYLELHANQLDAASRRIAEALESAPEDADAHVAAGYIALHRGEVDDAERHARFALGQDSNDRDAIQLWSAVKARRSLLLGLWWRFNAALSLRSERAQLGILIGSFVLVRVLVILADAFDLDALSGVLSLAWLGWCAYTWIGPSMFQRMIARELGKVELDPDY